MYVSHLLKSTRWLHSLALWNLANPCSSSNEPYQFFVAACGWTTWTCEAFRWWNQSKSLYVTVKRLRDEGPGKYFSSDSMLMNLHETTIHLCIVLSRHRLHMETLDEIYCLYDDVEGRMVTHASVIVCQWLCIIIILKHVRRINGKYVWVTLKQLENKSCILPHLLRSQKVWKIQSCRCTAR